MDNIPQRRTLYTLSPDDIDLSYFYRSLQLPKNGMVRPLWTDTGFTSNEYYEFKVVEEEEKDNDAQVYYDHNLICESYMCHICNINVPKMYRNEHNQTAKHKVCTEIASISLERSRKYVSEEYNYQKSVLKYDCYFCPSCSAAVATEQRSYHENTAVHAISSRHDILLTELVKCYLDINNVEIDIAPVAKEICGNFNDIDNTVSKGTTAMKTSPQEVGQDTRNIKLDPSTTKMKTTNDPVKVSVDGRKLNSVKDQCKPNIGVVKSDEDTNTTLNETTDSRVEKVVVINNTKVNGTRKDINVNEAANVDRSNKKSEIDLTKLTTAIVDLDNKETKTDLIKLTNANNNLRNGKCNTDTIELKVANFNLKNKKSKRDPNKLSDASDNLNDSKSKTEANELTAANADPNDSKSNTDIIKSKAANVILKGVKSTTDSMKLPVSSVVLNEGKSKTDAIASTGVNVDLDDEDNDSNSKTDPVELILKKKRKRSKRSKGSKSTELLKGYYNLLSVEHKVKIIGENLLEIKPVSGGIVRIDAQRFHSYYLVHGRTFCQLCSTYIDDVIESHMFSEDHVLAAKSPILDPNCVRRFSPYYFHCVLCNEVVRNVESHITDNRIHQNSLKEVLVVEEVSDNSNIDTVVYKNVPGKMYCEICEVEINADYIKTHTSSELHRDNYDKKFPSDKSSTCINNDMKNEKIDDEYPSTVTEEIDDQIPCRVCKTEVSTEILHNHIESEEHNLKCQSLLKDNKINTHSNGHYCELCKVDLHIVDLMDHIESPQHMSRLKKKKNSVETLHDHYQLLELTKNFIHCRVCDCVVVNEPSQLVEHLSFIKHQNNFTHLIEDNRLVRIGSSAVYYCFICTQLVADREIGHVKNKDHIDKMKQLKGKDSSPRLIIELHPHMGTTDYGRELKCKVCHTVVSCLVNSIEEHVKGKNHIKNYNRIMDKFNRTNIGYVCTICKVGVRHNRLLDHNCEDGRQGSDATTSGGIDCKPIPDVQVSNNSCYGLSPHDTNVVEKQNHSPNHGENHTNFKNYDQLVSKDKCFSIGVSSESQSIRTEPSMPATPKDNNNMKQQNVEVNLAEPKNLSSNAMPKSSQNRILHEHMEETNDQGAVNCKICNVLVPNNDNCLFMHNKGSKHKNKYNTLIGANKIDERLHCFYCGFCEILLPKALIIEHTFSDSHKSHMKAIIGNPNTATPVPNLHYLLEKSLNPMFLKCKICKIDIFNKLTNAVDHVDSYTHTNNYDIYLDMNSLVLHVSGYYCDLCKEVVPHSTEYNHMESKNHKDKLITKTYFCNCCKVTVPNNWDNVQEHSLGAKHQSKLFAAATPSI